MEYIQFLTGSVPLIVLAGSAVAYVMKYSSEVRDRKHLQFFEVMAHLDEKGTIAKKVASVYHLRSFPEHAEFISRFCREQAENVSGDASELLRDEFLRTAKHFSRNK